MSSIENALNSVEIPVEGVVYVAARPTLGTPRIARIGRIAQAAEGIGATLAGVGATVGVAQAAQANNLAAEANAQNAAALAAAAWSAARGLTADGELIGTRCRTRGLFWSGSGFRRTQKTCSKVPGIEVP